MGKKTFNLDKNFLEVHPDIAALLKEVKEKEQAIKSLKKKRLALKEDLKAARKELEKRLAVIENWGEHDDAQPNLSTNA